MDADQVPSFQAETGSPGDAAKRALMVRATCAIGGAGLLAAAYPFVASFAPSLRELAAGGPVDVDISSVEAGELMTVAWRGKPVWIMGRTPGMVRALEAPNAALADPLSAQSAQPDACKNATRSLRPGLFVAVGVCTHLGCSPTLRLDDATLNAELHAPGGFFCPCHGSRFDLAGRVVKNVPAPANLEIPPYRFEGPSNLTIG